MVMRVFFLYFFKFTFYAVDEEKGKLSVTLWVRWQREEENGMTENGSGGGGDDSSGGGIG